MPLEVSGEIWDDILYCLVLWVAVVVCWLGGCRAELAVQRMQ